MKHLIASEECIQLLIPQGESNIDPEISIVIPALNEQITIEEFIKWCWDGLDTAGVNGEVIIVDSSNDLTPAIALNSGARVLRTPKRGLGQAYLDAIPFIRGKFIIMGDCDLTYDFRKLKDFICSYKAGNDFVMGSRFRGTIEPGSMPPLHRYFGTPLTTWILNKIYRTNYSDIHCGMRGIKKESLIKINLTSTGWEYASEMVLKAKRIGLKIDEVPVTFYKDRDGRLSHHRRAGFWSPWHAGWINLKVMLVFSPDSFLIKPGIISIFLGLIISTPLLFGPIFIGNFGFDLYTMVFGVMLVIFGYAIFQIGILSRLFHGYRSGMELKIMKVLNYDNGMIASISMLGVGLLLILTFLISYIVNDYKVSGISYVAIEGVLLVLTGIQTFGFTLLSQLIKLSSTRAKNAE